MSCKVVFLLVVGFVLLLPSSAYAEVVSWAEAKALAAKTRGAEIPVSMNRLVLERLNRFLGTPAGRRTIRERLRRLAIYQPLIDRKARQYGLPRELIAISLYESGLDNTQVSSMKAAGLWQFLPRTARSYGLEVSKHRDERFDPELSTDAAMRYHRDLYELFQDWRLAFKAYNEGQTRIRRRMARARTRDPWALERQDRRGRYLSGVMAMLLIVKNPTLVERNG